MAKAKTIEENFRQLEELIDKLEGSDMSLDEAFKTYEAGIRLTAECSRQLDKVEKQIIVLKAKDAQSDEE